MATFLPLLWEKISVLNDGCFIQALVQAQGKARCSYFAYAKLPLAGEITLHITLRCMIYLINYIAKSHPTPHPLVSGGAAYPKQPAYPVQAQTPAYVPQPYPNPYQQYPQPYPYQQYPWQQPLPQGK